MVYGPMYGSCTKLQTDIQCQRNFAIIFFYTYTRLENQTRRENLVFHGISEDPDENWQDSENKIRTYVCDDLGIDESSISIERAHRLKTKTFPRPIIAKFTMFKDRDRILNSYREKRDSVQNEDHVDQITSGANATENEAAEKSSEPVVRVS